MRQLKVHKGWAAVAVAFVVSGASLTGSTMAFAQTQTRMNWAADTANRKAEAEMNADYRKLSAVLTPNGKAALLKSQVAWRKFREAEAAFLSFKVKGGSVYPMVYAGRMQELTQGRTRQLKKEYVILTTEGAM